jgi:hypothetical protein
LQDATSGSSVPLARAFQNRRMGSSGALTRKVQAGTTLGSSSTLTRQFRNATLESLDALNAEVHLVHARIFIFINLIFMMAKNSLDTKQKFTLNKDGSSIATNEKFIFR